MLRINVKETTTREEINRKTGAVFHKQRVALQQGQYDLAFDVTVDPSKPYPVGAYTFSPDSFRTNQFGGIELNRFDLRLVPFAAAAQPK